MPQPERLIVALRAGRTERTPEAEPVLVDLHDDTATLTLDDGETLSFDAAQLRAALDADHRQAA